MDVRTVIVKRPLRFTAAHRRLALILLLVVAGGILAFALLHHGESVRTTPASPPTGQESPAEAAPLPTAPTASAAGAPSAPVSIRIDAIGASAPVDPLGLNADGTLEVPTDFSRAGYYTGRPPPGTIGPAIIVAHVDSKTGPAVFYRLRDLKPGDEVAVTRADGSAVVFAVERVEQHAKDAFPTEAVYGPTSEAALRLITCGGPFEPTLGDHYRDNVIVFARMAGWVS
jgi:hypothetical protein